LLRRSIVVGSTKDLKPAIFNLLNRMVYKKGLGVS